jgi:hypothetical protein
MSTYNSFAWLPLCAGLTGVGLVLSYVYGRRRGTRAMLRGAAWSLLPIAAYLTGSIEMFWKMGSAIGTFATSFVLSPKVWSGIAVAGLALVLFVVTGGFRRRRRRRASRAVAEGAGTDVVPSGDRQAVPAARQSGAVAAPGADTVPVATKPAPAKRGKKAAVAEDDDMKEIEEILRRRGIS